MSEGSTLAIAVDSYIDSLGAEQPQADKLQIIVDLITSNQVKLVQLIEALGDKLKQEDGVLRAKALECLSETLEKLPSDKLSKLEINHLTKFFIVKFDDLLTFKQVLSGINALILMYEFSFKENLIPILTNLCDNYNSKNFSASIRYETLKILDNLVKADNSEGKGLLVITSGNEFNDLYVKTFLNIATGEKDPRNLMLSFRLNEAILSKFNNMQVFKEDLFDISFCYFPIAFKPPKNDPYKITSQDLKTALRNALTANELTVDDLLPNLFEKLTSNSSSVKQDVLLTLRYAISKFSTETVHAHWVEIWDALKFQVLNDTEIPYAQIISRLGDIVEGKPDPNLDLLPNDERERQEAIEATSYSLLLFSQIIRKLASNSSYVSECVSRIVEELKTHIVDSKTKLAKPAYLLLSAVAQSNDFAFNNVMELVSPVLIKPESLLCLTVDEQLILIDEVFFFLHSYKNLYGTFQKHRKQVIDMADNVLFKFKDEIIIILTKSLLSSSNLFTNLKVKALKNLTLTVSLYDFLSFSEVKMILNYLTDILVDSVFPSNGQRDGIELANRDQKEATFGKIYPSCLDLLAIITELNSELVSSEFFPQFFSLLPDYVEEGFLLSRYQQILQILSDLSSRNSNLLEIFSIRLVSKLNILISNHTNCHQDNQYLDYGGLIVNVLYDTLFKFLSNNPNFKTDSSFLTKCVPILLKLTLSIDADSVFSNDHFLELASRILYLIILKCKVHKHQELLDEFTQVFLSNYTGVKTELKIITLEPHSLNIIECPTKFISLFVKLIAGIDFKSTKLLAEGKHTKFDFVDDIISLLVDNSVTDIYQRLLLLQLLCLTINKWFNDEQTSFLIEKYNILTHGIESSIQKAHYTETMKYLEVFTWITKALILKRDKLIAKFTDYMLTLIDIAAKCDVNNEFKLGNKVSKSFEILVDEGLIFKTDCTKSVTKNFAMLMINKEKNHNINSKSLYKQKLFGIAVPKLISSFQQNTKLDDDKDVELDSYEVSLLKKTYCLMTLSLIANYMSTEIILSSVEEFFSLLIESVKLNDSQVRVAALTTIDSIIMAKTGKFISGYLSSLMPLLIDCFKSANYFKKDLDGNPKAKVKLVTVLKINKRFVKCNSQQVRELSLACLIKLAQHIDLIKLMPFKEEVLKNLMVPLDDKKRDVRKKACDCRQQYFELGQIKS